MTKKLIFIDLDGTLLNSKGELSSFSCEVIKKVVAKGHVVCLASGRPWSGISHIYEELGLDTVCVTYNGMHIHNPKDPSFKEIKKTFPLEECKKILKEIDFPLLNVCFEDEEKLYIRELDELVLGYFPTSRKNLIQGDALEKMDKDLYCYVFETEREDDDKLKAVIESHPPMRYRHWSRSKNSEVFYEDGDKGSACSLIASYYGVNQEDTIAFGDSPNDFTMLSYVGKAYVAIPCLIQDLLDKFEALKKSNDQDGVAHKLEELFL